MKNNCLPLHEASSWIKRSLPRVFQFQAALKLLRSLGIFLSRQAELLFYKIWTNTSYSVGKKQVCKTEMLSWTSSKWRITLAGGTAFPEETGLSHRDSFVHRHLTAEEICHPVSEPESVQASILSLTRASFKCFRDKCISIMMGNNFPMWWISCQSQTLAGWFGEEARD